ncbi:hypothetical protein BSL78_10748 [Apostichopus japonicus]|uniref:Peptidase C19 ubiquitin carboxyl-terminal hydrolase domain-containing protein n=1 Tax=Stichopus japonicus TaxID=307972 RepID=A0A2G8KWG1_STIJA|nr:hypothetical protein BSL78_10748 [Apostichopus japonicus]
MLEKWYNDDKEDISTREDVSLNGTERHDESATTNWIRYNSQSEEKTNDDTHDLTPSEERFCICCEVNDGSPFLQCDIWDNWYHFRQAIKTIAEEACGPFTNITSQQDARYHYKLVSAVAHQGVDCRSGHYNTYTFWNNGVVRHNDEDVERSPLFRDRSQTAVNGVILFYELSSESSVTTWFTKNHK